MRTRQRPLRARLRLPSRSQPRQVRPADAHVDTEALIRQVVGRIQNQGTADTTRIKDAVRKAVAILQAAVS